MYIIAGLGNPGKEYENTRHNIGFDVIDRLAEEENIAVMESKHKALIGKGYVAGQKVILAKPQTFMNLSGESLRAACDFFKVDPEEGLIVIYDDISLEPGQLRIRLKGSAGGHNGIKSLIACLGSEAFNRFRIGVGHPKDGHTVIEHVLQRPYGEDIELIEAAKIHTADSIEDALAHGVDHAMNAFNPKKKK